MDYSSAVKKIKAGLNQQSSSRTSSGSTSSAVENIKKGISYHRGARDFGFDTLGADIEALNNTINSAYKGWQPSDKMQSAKATLKSMYERLQKYQEHRKRYGGEDLSELLNYYKTASDNWDSLSKTYGNYKNMFEYEREKNKIAELNSMSSAELFEKIKPKTISEMTPQERFTAQNLIPTGAIYDHDVAYTTADGTKIKWEDLISNARDRETRASADFGKFVESGKGVSSSEIGTTERRAVGRGRLANTPKVNSDLREFALALERKTNGETSSNSTSYYDTASVFDKMTDKEVEMAYYYIGLDKKQGNKDYSHTENYMKSLMDSLNARRSVDIAKMVEDKPWGEFGFSIEAGLDQWSSGMKGLTEENIPTSPIQYASGIVRENVEEDYGKIARTMYDFGVTGANMLPSIGVATMLSAIAPELAVGSLASKAMTGISKGAGLATMGASVKGNAYQEMLDLGYDKEQATTYSNLVAASEVGLEYLMGGIGKLGGTSAKVSKAVSQIDNGLARFAIQFPLAMASEGAEEGLQEILTPMWQRIATGESESVDWGEVAYSALLGGLMGGMYAGPGLAISTVSETARNKAIGQDIKANDRVGDVFDLANNPEIASAYEAYNRFTKKGITAENVSDAKLGRLYGMAYTDAQETVESREVAKAEKIMASEKATAEQKAEAQKILDKRDSAQKTIDELKVLAQHDVSSRTGSAKNLDEKAFEDYDTEAIVNLIESGLESAEDTDAHRIATEYKAKIENYDELSEIVTKKMNGEKLSSEETKVLEGSNAKLSTKEIRNLAVATDEVIRAEENAEIASELMKRGESAEVAEIVARKMRGETLTEEESKLLAESEKADSYITEKTNKNELKEIAKTMEEDKGALLASLYNGNTDVESYTNAFNLAVAKAENNFSFEDIRASVKNVLSNEQIGKIYKEVRIKADQSKRAEFQKLVVKTAKIKAYKGVVDDSVIDYENKNTKGKVNWKDISPERKKEITFVKGFAQIAGLNLKVVTDGKKQGFNGAINIDKNTIYIDIFAEKRVDYKNLESAIIPAFSHELTHWMEYKSPVLFRKVSSIVFSTLQRVDGLTESERIAKEVKRLTKKGIFKETDTDAQKEAFARSEIVARGCEDMLSRSKVGREMFYSLEEKEQKTFVDKIKDIIKSFKEWINGVLKFYDTASAEAKALRRFDAEMDKLSKLWDKMLLESIEVNQALEKSGAFEHNAEVGKKVSKTRELMFNERLIDTHMDSLEDNYSEESSLPLSEILDRYNKIIDIWKRIGGELKSDFLNDWNNKVGKDRTFTVFKKQVGYKYNVELSSMCKKGIPLFEAIDTIVKQEVMKELDIKVIGKAEKEILYDILKSHNFEIPCAICYVEQARQREGDIIFSFLNGQRDKSTYKLGWNETLERIQTEMEKDGFHYEFPSADRSIATDKYTPSDITMDEETQEHFFKALKKVANEEIRRYNKEKGASKPLITKMDAESLKKVFKGKLPLNMVLFKTLINEPSSRFMLDEDLLYSSMTTQNLASSHNGLYSLFNSQGGAGGYKSKQGSVIYWGDILKKNWIPATVRNEGGVRNQSNSDFLMYTLLDHAQMYIDFTAKGYYLQAYTKVIPELKLFGLSKGKINASFIPKVVIYKNADGSIDVEKTKLNAGLDENGNPIYDDIEGVNHTEAFMLIEDAEYSKSIGGVCIGYSDAHISKLLDDKKIQLIIGFHDKTDDPTKRYKGAVYAKNYNGLNEATKLDSEGKLKTVHIGFNQFIRRAEGKFKNKESITYNGKSYTKNDIPKLATDLYLENCEKKGLNPAYSQGGTDFSKHPNYYKLLADFSLYDSNGNYAPHEKVEYNMPDNVPYLDENGNKAYEKSEDYIKRELKKELDVRDAISESLADKSEEGIIPQFVKRVKEMHEDSGRMIFSMREDVEETNDLIAVHNLNSEQLTDVISRGQFAMPSIAVTNKGHTAFGDISVVFAKDTIDPALDTQNKLYGADAWTPTQTRLKKNPVFNDAEVSTVLKDIKGSIGRGFSQVFDISKSEFKNTISKADGSIYDAFSGNIGMQTAYALKNKLITKVPKTDGRIDTALLKEQLDAKLDNDTTWRNYKKWLGEISDSVITSYDKATNEDIMRNMKAQPDSAKTFKLTENGELTVPAAEYSSIDEYKQNKGRLSENAEAEAKVVGQNFVDWATDISTSTNVSTRNVVNAINSSFAHRYDANDIVKSFADKGVSITRTEAKALQELYKKAVELPTQYFEAKPQRAVGLNEIAMVVLPDNANAEVKSLLDENNIPYTEYESGNDSARLDALNSVEDVRFSERDSDGNTLSEGQIDFFKESKARDAEGNLLALYHGTPSAGFTVFNPSNGRYGGNWFTTSRIDADSYAGNYQHKLFNPDEKDDVHSAVGGNFTLNSEMRFDSAEDLANFKKKNPGAENYLTSAEIDEKLKKAQEDGDWDEYDRLEEYQYSSERRTVERAYDLYEWEHSRYATVGEILENPDAFSITDLIRAYDSIDKNNMARDSVEEGATKEDLVESLRRMEDEAEEGESITDIKFKARLNPGENGTITNRANTRTYACYVNAVNPYEINADGNPLSMNGLYSQIEKAMKNSSYDSVIVRNARVGAYQELGDIVIIKESEQAKLTTNTNPTSNPDIRYSERVSNEELASMDDTALYIKNTKNANYIKMIFNGAKTEETRSRRTLDAFIGKDFYVTDGEYVYGSVVLGEPHKYTETDFHKRENQLKHRVPVGDEYDIKKGGIKWAYPIESYKKFDKPEKLSDSKDYKNSFQARQVLYSERDDTTVYDILGENERIRKENEAFKAEIERLNERLKIERTVTHGNYFNEKQLSAVAGHLRKISNSNIDKLTLMKSLKEVYSFIAHSEELTWEDVYTRCYDIADAMLKEAKPITIVNDYSKHLLREIRNTRISLDDAQKAEAQYHFGKNWNRNFMGKVIISNDGANIDSQWQEWSHLYPEVFSADTNSSDMIRELYDIIESLKSASEIVDTYGMEEQTRWLANEIYNQYWNISPIRTTADKYEGQIKRLTSEHRRAMKEYRDAYETRLKEQVIADDIHYGKKINDLRSKNERLEAQRKKAMDLVREIRTRKNNEITLAKQHGREMMDKYKENASKKTLIQRITSTSLSLKTSLEKNSKDDHIPEVLKGPVIKLLTAIDFSSKQMLEKGVPTMKDISFKDAFASVQAMLKDAENNVEGLEDLYGHDLAEQMKLLSKAAENIVGDNNYVINAMSVQELKALDKLVRYMKSTVNRFNKFHVAQHNAGVESLGVATTEDVDSAKRIYKDHKKHFDKLKTKTYWNQLNPYYAFKNLGPSAMKIFEAFQDGQDKVAFLAKEVIDFTESLYTNKEYKKWAETFFDFEIVQPSGKTAKFRMNVPQIMSLYCVSKQEDAKKHLLHGNQVGDDIGKGRGITIVETDETEAVRTNILLTEADLNNILAKLNDVSRAKDVADNLQEFMSTRGAELGNEISMARWGIKSFGIENYFPIKVSDGAVPDKGETPGVQGNPLVALLNMSFTHSRNQFASQSIEIGDIFDVFSNHMSSMIQYNAMALPVLDMFKWMNVKVSNDFGEEISVKTSIKNTFGDYAWGYFNTFLKDVNGTTTNDTRDNLGVKFFKNAKVAKVAANIRVALLQFTSYIRAGAVMDNKYLLKALVHKPKSQRAKEYCGIALWKSLGYYDTDITRPLADKIKHSESVKDKVIEGSLKGAEKADEWTWGYLWNACELEVRETRKDLKVGSKEFNEEIGKRLREVVYRTQVVDSTLTRSQMMRSKSGWDKMLTTFASESTLSFNLITDLFVSYKLDSRRMGKEAAKRKHGKYMRKAITAYVVTNVVTTMLATLFDAFRDYGEEDKDEKYIAKLMLENFATNTSFINKIPYVNLFVSILSGFSASRVETDWMESATKGTKEIFKLVSGEGSGEKAFKYMLKSLSDATGIAGYNIYRDIRAFLELFD